MIHTNAALTIQNVNITWVTEHKCLGHIFALKKYSLAQLSLGYLASPSFWVTKQLTSQQKQHYTIALLTSYYTQANPKSRRTLKGTTSQSPDLKTPYGSLEDFNRLQFGYRCNRNIRNHSQLLHLRFTDLKTSESLVFILIMIIKL